MASKMPYVKFANGYECPILGLGTWKVNNKILFFPFKFLIY